MGALLELLDGILSVGEIYSRYGIKGCLLVILFFVVLLGGIYVLAVSMGS